MLPAIDLNDQAPTNPLPASGERENLRARPAYCSARQARSMRAQASRSTSFEVA
jgi:hypothetical protein